MQIFNASLQYQCSIVCRKSFFEVKLFLPSEFLPPHFSDWIFIQPILIFSHQKYYRMYSVIKYSAKSSSELKKTREYLRSHWKFVSIEISFFDNVIEQIVNNSRKNSEKSKSMIIVLKIYWKFPFSWQDLLEITNSTNNSNSMNSSY